MNIAGNQTRSIREQEKIGRRSGIIDDRRSTRAPVLETNANIRDARRGDVGGTQALLRSLGMLSEGIADVGNSQLAKHIDNEQDNIARGAADAAAGTVDDEMLERSLGYRNAVTKGRTVTAFSRATREFSEELAAAIESQDSPFLEERLADIEQRLEGFYTDFAVDPETGEMREFLQSPGAMRYLAEAIQTSRPQAMQRALDRVEERFNSEALSHYSEAISDQALDTGTVDLEQARSLLPESVTDEEVASNTIIAVGNAVNALRAQGRFEEATTLLAQLRGSYSTPVDPGDATSAPSGVIPAGDVATLQMPVQGRITSGFGEGRSTGSHNGVDIAVPVGTPVPAAMGGEIIRVWTADAGGMSVKVRYDDGTVAGFAHLSEQPISEGRFNAGDVIAVTGNTGRSTGPHLHYTLTRDGQKIDPASAEFGPMSFDPDTQAAPTQRLRDPNVDPVTAIEQSGSVEPLPGIEGITFSPTQQAQIDQLYETTTDVMRREWEAANAERYSENATNLALGVYGVDGRVTTMQDIRTAYEAGEIDGDAVMALIGIRERRDDRAEAQAEREESRRERAERRRRDRSIEAGSEVLIGQLLRGEVTAPEARQAAILASARISDPIVASTILSNVTSVANARDSAVMKSEPVVQQLAAFERQIETSSTTVQALVPDLPLYRYGPLQEAYQEGVEQAAGRYASLVASGTDPETAAIMAQTLLTEVETQIVTTASRAYGPGN